MSYVAGKLAFELDIESAVEKQQQRVGCSDHLLIRIKVILGESHLVPRFAAARSSSPCNWHLGS